MNAQDLQQRVAAAVREYWQTRDAQAGRQGRATDQGARAAVTGGAQMNGFARLVVDLALEAGCREDELRFRSKIELPGWFRAEKKWDLLVIIDKRLVAAIEFKSQAGSFGNNFNNRTEEALGSATDLLAAYREGAFKPAARPWLGYLMLLEDCPASTRPIGVEEPHYKVFPEFRGASYAKRYEILITKLLRERLYDGAALLLSARPGGDPDPPSHTEPNPELSVVRFAETLVARVAAACSARGPG